MERDKLKHRIAESGNLRQSRGEKEVLCGQWSSDRMKVETGNLRPNARRIRYISRRAGDVPPYQWRW